MPASENPLMPRIIIKDRTGATTLHTYNAFNLGSNDIHISSLDLKFSLQSLPEADIKIEDSGNTLDQDVINGCKVLIDLGKTEGALARKFSGYVRGKKVVRSDTGTFEMMLHCLGSGVRFNERLTSFNRMAKRTAVNSGDPDTTDAAMQAQHLMKNLVEQADHLPIGEPLESFTTTGVDTSVIEVIPCISMKYMEWSDIAGNISDTVGAIWYVDENDNLVFKYPTLTSSGIVVKDGPASSLDSADTCYFIGGFTIEDSIRKSDGFANRLYGRGGNELAPDAFSATDAASTSLHDRSLAIQFTPTDTWNASAVTVILSKTGSPVITKGRMAAVLRVSRSNTPGYPISQVYFETEHITSSPTVVTFGFSARSVGLRNLQYGHPHWLELSKINGTVDASNTINWHRDIGTSGRNAYKTPGGSWTVQSSSYTFTYGQLFSRQVLQEASDSDSIDTYGVIEAVIDAPWILDGRTMDKYLTAILSWTSRPKRIYTIPVCTIPDTLPMPGQTVELRDTKTGFTTGNTAELLEAAYHWNALESGMGIIRMSMKLLQYPTNERLLARV